MKVSTSAVASNSSLENHTEFPQKAEDRSVDWHEKKARWFRHAWFFFLAIVGFGIAGLFYFQPWGPSSGAAQLTGEERQYFQSLYRDTWNYLAHQIDAQTHLPYDSSARQPVTSISNIGFYVASTTVAYQTGLIPREEAVSRIGPCLRALEKIEKWRGFPRPWFLVRTLRPAFGDEFSYDSHLSVLIGGLVVAQNTFPEISVSIGRLLGEMRFKDLYDGKSGWLKGGYNVPNQDFAVMQPWGHWYYKYFASEVRLLSFYGIARHNIPRRHWSSLVRRSEKKEGERLLVSGFDHEGLEVQYLAGLFLDERQTLMGRSQRNLAKYQMKHARRVKAPVWGWAASQAPSRRYLVHGDLKDEVVAPYASILAAIYYPHEAYRNLKKLESFGLRPSGEPGDKLQFGFLDSINWKTKSVSPDFMTPSHGMSFLALANLLYDGVLWKTFEKDPVVQKGLKMLRS